MKELTAADLRINNLISYDHIEEGDVINSVTWEDLKWLSENQTLFNEFHKPIPLTEEWLERFGFEREKVDFGYTHSLNKLTIHNKEPFYPNGRLYYNSWAIMNKMPEYVHTLQNLYYALTGEELTLKTQ